MHEDPDWTTLLLKHAQNQQQPALANICHTDNQLRRYRAA